MKRIFYYTTTAIIISCGISQAQTCVPTPTCSSLGYTSSSACDGGLKCPFGEAWYCPISGSQDITELCSLMGYSYTCTGTNESAGTGQTCSGLYKECTCLNNSEWNGTNCVCDSSYKFSCTGTGYSGGSGIACSGKYKECYCESGYEWKGSSCSVASCRGYSSTYYCEEDAIDYSDWCQSGSSTYYKCSACNSRGRLCEYDGSCISPSTLCTDDDFWG